MWRWQAQLEDELPVPPRSVRREMERGLDWASRLNRGRSRVAELRARQVLRGSYISEAKLNHMVQYFMAHEDDSKQLGWSPGEPGFPTPERIGWALRGGDSGRAWAHNALERIEVLRYIQRGQQ